MTNKIQEQDNHFFSITHNKELDCFDMVLKQSKYDTSSELLGILSFVHQMGLNCPDNLRIGAQLVEESAIVVSKPKIIV